MALNRVLAARATGGHGDVDALRAEVESLQLSVEAAEMLEGRVAELEERLDFAERLLAQHDQPRLGGGDG
ncbi:MAG TPA: hypothetical protein VGA22_02525 [Gemmatimonadales bacterium]